MEFHLRVHIRVEWDLTRVRDPNVKKPEWLRQRAPQGEKYQDVKDSLSRLKLNTVCEEAQCPNIGEVLLITSLFIYLLFQNYIHFLLGCLLNWQFCV